MNLHFRQKFKLGYNKLVSISDNSLKHIEFGIVKLEKDTLILNSGSNELVLVILSGMCTVKCNDNEWNLSRKNVFDELASSVYIPPKLSYEITTKDAVEMAVCASPTESGAEPTFISSDRVNKRIVGRDNWQRTVYDIVGMEFPATKLLVGETINPPGNWSSWPPHKHDEMNPPEEIQLEEIYFYKLFPEQGFGFQRLYTPSRDLDEAFILENNDIVLIPKGFHPVVAGGGYKIYYLWMIAGRIRQTGWKDDTAHEWISSQKR